MHDQAFAHCQRFFTAAANADGPCFSPTVAFLPFRKAMDPWLGVPLPHLKILDSFFFALVGVALWFVRTKGKPQVFFAFWLARSAGFPKKTRHSKKPKVFSKQ
jgi:hypothetical protein